MSWATSFESPAGEIHETMAVRLGGKAPSPMVEQLIRSATGQAMADGASLTSSRATRSNKETELSKYVLLQGKGQNAVGSFAVFGIFNTATHHCIFWKKYFELSPGGSEGGSAASSSPSGSGRIHAASTPVLPRSSAVVTPSSDVRSPSAAASAGSSANYTQVADVARGSAEPVAGGATTSAYAGQKRMHAIEGAESDEFLIEKAMAIAMVESAAVAAASKAPEVAEHERVRQIRAASTEADSAFDADKAAKDEVRAASSTAALSASKARAAVGEADAAAAAAREAEARANEARAAAEADLASLRNLEAAQLRTQEVRAAAMRRFYELVSQTAVSATFAESADETAEHERVRQIRAASTEADSAFDADEAAKDEVRAASSTAALSASMARAAVGEADAAAAAAREAEARANEASAAAEAYLASLRNLEAAQLRTQEVLAAAMHRFNELVSLPPPPRRG